VRSTSRKPAVCRHSASPFFKGENSADAEGNAIAISFVGMSFIGLFSRRSSTYFLQA
jgi:hypothetical protein